VLNCAVLSDVVPHGHRVADIGSGAGLPGLVLGIARPDLRLTLIEPLERRCAFLREAVEVLGLGNVVVIRARAEQMHGTERFDAVTSRAVAPLSRLLTWSMPLVSDAGAMLAMKGSSAAREVSEAAAVLADLRCAAPEILTVGSAHGEHDPQMSPATVVRVAHADPVPVALRESDRGRGPRRRGRRKAGT
jgi:16S rRNA (guanine527-N7)-methyltransferase